MLQLVVQTDSASTSRFAATLQFGVRAALDEAWKTLQAWGHEYKQRVERVTPVGRGAARQSWFITARRSADSMTVTLAHSARGDHGNQPYPFYLEFGTDRIAADRVKTRQPGDAVATAWPAKTARPAKTNEPPVAPHFGPRSAEQHVDVISHAFASSDAQLPLLRAIGYELAPQIVESLQEALARGFQGNVSSNRTPE